MKLERPAAAIPALFATARPDLTSADGTISTWFVEPAGMVTIFMPDARGDLPAARYLSDEAHPALRKRFPGRRLLFIHDFSRLRGYTTDARKHVTEWGLRTRGEIEAVVPILPDGNALLKMGVTAAAAVLRVAGIRVDPARSLDEVIKKLGLTLAR